MCRGILKISLSSNDQVALEFIIACIEARPDMLTILKALAALGFNDLLAMTARPTPHARSRPDRLCAYRERMQAKNWPGIWPMVTAET